MVVTAISTGIGVCQTIFPRYISINTDSIFAAIMQKFDIGVDIPTYVHSLGPENGKEASVVGSRQSTRITKSLPPDAPLGSGQIILVVEDDHSLRRMVGAQLRSLGYDTIEAGDALAALKMLECNVEIKLLLTDIVLLDNFNGVDLGTVARELRPTLKLMYMSAYPASGMDTGTPLEKGVVLLRKPFRRSDIAAAVEKALNGP